MAGMMFVFGFIMPGIDNYAHAGGFVGGYLAGRLLDPLEAGADQSHRDCRRLSGAVGARHSGVRASTVALTTL